MDADRRTDARQFWSERRVLVTGASGFLGKHLVERLRMLGATVHGTHRSGEPPSEPITWWRCCLDNAEETRTLVRQIGPDIIFHLASHVTTRRDPEMVSAAWNHTAGTAVNILCAAAESGIPRTILVSSAEVSLLPQTRTPAPYTVAKKAAELVAELYRNTYGLPVLIARPTLIYGPGQSADKLVPYIIQSLLQNRLPRLKNSFRRCDLLFVDDAVSGLLRLAEYQGNNHVWELASGTVVTLGELAQRIASHLGVTGPAYVNDTNSDDCTDLIVNPQVAWRELDWRPAHSLAEGLNKTVEYFERVYATPVSETTLLRRKILQLTQQYYYQSFAAREPSTARRVPVAGRTFDAEELTLLVDAALDFWLTSGRYAQRFERDFAAALGVRHAILCNSGSSANLLAIAALTAPELGENRLQPGDEVITVAAGFPTTVNPIIQCGLIPVFVDIELGTYNAPADWVQAAISSRTRAVFLPHTLGNPYDLAAIGELCRKHGLWLIEDNCDAVGSRYQGKYTGSFGDLATVSFYPAHQLTMGEGGCVLTSNGRLKTLVESFRDWGRSCWCAPGKDNTCGKRFSHQLGSLPHGYDHKYIYSHIGYNLKATDLQAAIGVAQLQKLEQFTAQRRHHWEQLYQRLQDWEEFFVLPRPTPSAEPSWFGFLLTLRPTVPFTRQELVTHLESHGVATRMLFAGNLVRQPAYQNVKYRISGTLANTDLVMHRAFWIGVYPGLTIAQIHYAADVIEHFLKTSCVQRKRKAS